ncbi:hypothetical protein [Streptomyces brasiliensis]|uniref:ATP-binding protein n=1 Tax=Streptomyces brasiliensis TaxID=1954 RepID=A0A917NRH9_9ACTN|nr:hypothetical protein [Streptomyces brasiliensis]GGJ21110.1 hypothetical protein GCM10010121_035200 [Streptomyces brasiliensis]
MARHASPVNSTARRALFALATAGAALGAGAATASAADAGPLVDVPPRSASLGDVDPLAGLQAVNGSLPYATDALRSLKPNPLAGTGVDPLDNGIGTQVADFKPVTSRALTAPIAEAQSLGGLPVVGPLLGTLGH